jgi:hypothetical protein
MTGPRRLADPILGLSGSVHGLPSNASSQFDRYLQETFVARPTQTRRIAKARVRR